jgi:hypothetical protein
MKIRAVLGFAAILLPACNALSQDASIRVYITPSLIKKLDNVYMVDAVRVAFSQLPFRIETRPTDGTLIITEATNPVSNQHALTFAVAFFRNGSHIGDSVESCAYTKISDCTDQLVLDAKSASGMQ